VKKGANFAEIARQYSASGSASRGGDVGWLVVEKLPPAFRDALMVIENGDVTAPVVMDGAVYVFRRIAERKDGLADDSQTRVWLARAILPLSTDASEADRLETAARLRRDTEDMRGCDKISALNDTYGSGIKSRLDDLVIADLAPQMRKLLASLEQDVPSEPLAFTEGIASLMVCRTEKPQLALPSRDEIRQTLIDRAFGSLAERQLLRQRRKAIIEYIGQS
jgi:peptidyl-prolyl cis-trans isomerase SurA